MLNIAYLRIAVTLVYYLDSESRLFPAKPNWANTFDPNTQNPKFPTTIETYLAIYNKRLQLHSAGVWRSSIMPPRLVLRSVLRVGQSIYTRAYSSGRVSLAFDLHEPVKGSDPKNAPIIFMHGLFGSKKNNRSISKWASTCRAGWTCTYSDTEH